MRFRISRVSQWDGDFNRPVDAPLMSSVEGTYGEGGERWVEWFIDIDSMRDFAELDKAAGGHGLIVFTTDHDHGDTGRPCPEILIYDDYMG